MLCLLASSAARWLVAQLLLVAERIDARQHLAFEQLEARAEALMGARGARVGRSALGGADGVAHVRRAAPSKYKLQSPHVRHLYDAKISAGRDQHTGVLPSSLSLHVLMFFNELSVIKFSRGML